jgi:hypothetical protein
MAALDRAKEEIAYLKFWQGFMVVTDISLIGWLVTTGDEPPIRAFALAFTGAIALSCAIFAVHRRIDRRIDALGRL